MRRMVGGGVAVVVALVLAGCAGQDESAAPTHAPANTASSAAPTTLDPEQFTAPPSGVVDADTEETIEPQPVPVWDDASRASVLEAAETALRAFARPDLDHGLWWAELEPLLTTHAAEDYAYVDPANIPVRGITGEAFIVEDTSTYVATVEVPTDAGPYQVLLTRKNADEPWLVSRLAPVEQAG